MTSKNSCCTDTCRYGDNNTDTYGGRNAFISNPLLLPTFPPTSHFLVVVLISSNYLYDST